MHFSSHKSKKDYPKRPDLALNAPDPNTSLAHLLALVGERKKVLDVGCASGYLANLLGRRECDVVGIDINPSAAEEARKFCTRVIVADLDAESLSDLLPDAQFEAIVFGDVLEHLREPVRTLDESRALLGPNGFVVASIPNVSHGAVRLALLSGHFDYQEMGILDDSHVRFFTAKSIDELFLNAGFRVEVVERVTLPIFAPSDLIPNLNPRDYDPALVAEIAADPESETLQYVVKAVPLSNDQRLKMLSKRFFMANTELSNARQQLVNRERELERLSAVREQTQRTEAELAAVRSEYAKLESGYKQLESGATEREKLEKAYKSLEGEYLKLENAYRQLDVRVSEDANARRQLADRERRADEELWAARSEYAKLENGYRQLESRASEYEKLEKAYKSLEGEYAKLEATYRALEERLQASGKQVEASGKRADEAVARMADLEEELEAIRIASVAEKATMSAYLQDVRSSSVTTREELTATRADFAKLEDAYRDLENHLRSAEEARETLKSQLADAEAASRWFEDRAGAADARASDAETAVAQAGARVRDLERDVAALVEERDAIRIRIDEAAEANGSLEHRLSILREQVAVAEARGDEADAAADRLRAELDASRDQLADAQHRASDSGVLAARFESQFEEAMAKRDALAAANGAFEAAMEAKTLQVTNLQEHVRAMAAQSREALEETSAARTLAERRSSELERRLADLEVEYEATGNALAARYERQLDDAIAERKSLAAAKDAVVAAMEAKTLEAATLQEQVRAMVAQSRKALEETSAARTLAENRSSELEQRLADLEAEFETTQTVHRSERAAIEAYRTEMRDAAEAQNLERARIEREFDRLERTLTETRDELTAAVKARTAVQKQLREAQDQAREAAGHALHLESVLNVERQRLGCEVADSRQHVSDLEKQVASLGVRGEFLNGRLSEVEQRLVAQTEDLVALAQAESKQLTTLIDTVQSSHFWKLKRWIRSVLRSS